MADEDFSTKRLLSLRRLTRAVADLLRGQLKEYLGVLSVHFRPKPYLGEFMEGAKDFVKGAEANFNELKKAYDGLCTKKPFNLPADFQTPLSLSCQTVEAHPLEYVHEAKGASAMKSVLVTAPLRFALTYTGYGPKKLKDMLGSQGVASDTQEFLLHTLILNMMLARQPSLVKLLEALRFSVGAGKVPGCGDLPFTILTTTVPTILPPDEVIIESTEISGADTFEEVVNLQALATLSDPFRDKLVELARIHGETL